MNQSDQPETVHLPKPTGYPLAVAASSAVSSVGVMTDWSLCIAGSIMLVVSIGGWIRQLTPGRGHIDVPLVPLDQRAPAVARSTRKISQARSGLPENRERFPQEIHSYRAAAWGGLMAGAVMAVLAILHSLVMGKGLFYNLNLLSAILLRRFNDGGAEALTQFDSTSMILALAIHITASVSVGLMFGMILPMLPKSPLFWAGLVAPLMWSGLVFGLLGVINPVMNDHIDWFWFVVCQFGFGLTLGWYIKGGSKKSSWGRLHQPKTEGRS